VVILLVLLHADVLFLARGYVLAAAVGVAIYVVMFVRLFQQEGILQDLKRSDVRIPAREMFAFTLPLLTSSLVPVVIHSTATIILGYFHPATEVARYRAILPAAHLNNIVLASFGMLFTPTAARLFARGDTLGIRSLYWRTAVWMAVLSFPVFALTFSLAKSLTVTLYGSRYADSWLILQWVSGAYYFSTALGNNGLTLKVLGRLRYIVVINLLAMAANVVLTFLLVPRYGALGTGLATAIAITLHNFMKQAGLRAAGIGVFERRTLPVYAVIAIGAAALFLLQLLVDQILILLPVAILVSVLVLAFTKHELAVEDTFPELLRLPFLGTLLRTKTPKPFSRRTR
jgi:O-antigen/teichoic acid export membrane protein